MMSIIGLSDEEVESICAEARSVGEVVAANLNCPGQVAISGEEAALKRAAELAKEKGAKRAIPLKVSGAFHSNLMKLAEDKLAAELDEVTILEPRVPIVANVTGDYVRSPDQIREFLVRQLTSPVLWNACVQRLLGDGYDGFYEIGPGNVLAGLMRRIDRSQRVVNVSNVASLEQALQGED